MFDITNPWPFTSLGLPHRYRLDGDNLRFGLNRWNWLVVVGNAQRFLWKRRPEHRCNCSHIFIYIEHFPNVQRHPKIKDIQRHPSVLVKFDFNQVGFGFLFVFGHGKVGHDMRMFNYQWDNHGKRTSNNPINPVHRILNTLWKPWFRIDSIGSII